MNPTPPLRIIVVEDYPILREEIVLHLSQEGFSTVGVSCGEALNEELERHPADILVLDLNLPHEDGLSIANRIRRVMPEIGIVVLTARVRGTDKIQGYEAGADLYLTKPARPEELTAAIRNLARRLFAAPSRREPVWQLDVRRASLHAPGGEAIPLTANEALLLRRLAMAPQQFLEIHELLDCLGQPVDENGKAKLEVFLSRLRRKLEPQAADGPIVQAIRGRGYRLCLAVEVS
jgi:two-component system OmpR family response regulator